MDALCSTREKKDLMMMMMMITMMNCGVTVSRIQRITANIRIAVLNCDWWEVGKHNTAKSYYQTQTFLSKFKRL
jgi:hypothetical protein